MGKKKSRKTIAAQTKPIIPLLPYQREDVESNDRFRWNCWSRQTGKSFTKSLRRILRGVLRRRNQILLSAGERQSRELMDKARQHCQALKIANDFHDHQFFNELSIKQLEITLPGGVRIIGLPANPTTARGFTGDVFLDEFAMHADDRDIWAALFPTILRGQGELDIASTPKGRNNMFHELADNPRFSHGTVTLPDAIAQGLDVDAEELRQAMNDDLLYR
ncbi:MAG: terminase family protein, partial [Planctomycetota bacterium]